nr:rod shape-determining protein MreC [uncultured Neokomagataea sp.]
MLSIHAKQIVARASLPVLVMLAVGLLVIGWAKRSAVDEARLLAADLLAPAYHAMVWPQIQVRHWIEDLHGATDLARECSRLREENRALRHWYDVAVVLASENAQLKDSLHWIPEPTPQYVTGRVTRDDGGLYARAVLLDVGDGHVVRAGDVALDAAGLVGRVTEVGPHTVRVLQINDDASRIPVTLSTSHADAIMVGDDGATPRLMYYPQNQHPIEGERVQTRGQSTMPAGLPIGSVHYSAPNHPVVVPDADLARLDIVRIFDYGGQSLVAPDAPGRVKARVMDSKPLSSDSTMFGLPFLLQSMPVPPASGH